MKKKKSMGMNFWGSPSSTKKNKMIYQPNFRKQKAKVNAFNTSMNKPAKYFWGDWDKDKVYNMFDCDPRNPRKQGPQHKPVKVSTQFGVLGRIARAETKAGYQRQELKVSEREARKREETARKDIEKEYRRKLAAKEEEFGETPAGRKKLVAIRGELMTEQEKKIKNVPVEDFKERKETLAELKTRAKEVRAKFEREKAVEKRVSEVTQRALSEALPINEAVGAFTQQRKQMLAQSQGLFQQMNAGVGIKQNVSRAPGKGTGRVGRPQGSVKYYIPGVGAVGVYEWRRYVAQQTRIKRAKGELVQQNTPAVVDTDASSASSPVQQQAYSQPQTQPQQSAMSQVVAMMNAKRGQVTADQTQQIQQQMQEDDQILKAPQFGKGELKATGGSILTPNGPNILDAPNIMKGQMRNITERNPVEVGEKPITNPGGSEYIEIDPISGKPFVVRRVSEKWLDGRAI